MVRSLAFGFIIFIAGCSGILAQGEPTSAPVVWERYKFSNTAISILLPKMPIAVHRQDLCLQFVKNSYFAYADNAVYELSVVEKSYAPFPNDCRIKVPFGKSTLADRLNELRGDPAKAVETKESRHGFHGNKFAASGSTRWVVDDLEQGRWIEVAVTMRSDSGADEDKFFDSLDIAIELASTPGKQASLGSERTLGDADLKMPAQLQPKPGENDPLQIIIAPRASYTDEARKNNVQGTVRLKVVLMANGGTGNIDVVQPLEGLTEQAIAAAKKVVFLPRRVNGVPVNVIKTFEYGFSIY